MMRRDQKEFSGNSTSRPDISWPKSPDLKSETQQTRQDSTKSMGRMPAPQSRIGVSPRPGQGYDLSRFEYQPVTYQPLFQVEVKEPRKPGRYAKSHEQAAFEKGSNDFAKALSKERTAIMGRTDGISSMLDGVHGLFLPGDANRNPTQIGVDRFDAQMHEPKAGTVEFKERETRDPFEQAAIREARNRGMPILAVCGGSWRLLEAYGGQVETIPGNTRDIHQGRLADAAHDLTVAPHTMLGNASLPLHKPKTPITDDYRRVKGSNSTHWAMAHVDDKGKLVQRGGAPKDTDPPKDKPDPHTDRELVVTAWEPKYNHPEGFESRHGAPVIGIQSHPEYFLPNKPYSEFSAFSHKLFHDFEQATRTYANRQTVNAEILKKVPRAE